jgi:hypothetical protein
MIYPSGKEIKIHLNLENNYSIGGELYLLKGKKYRVSRLLVGEVTNTNLLLKCLDDNAKSMIRLSYVPDKEIFYGLNTSRSYATLRIFPVIDSEKQKALAEAFNTLLKEFRDKYHSLFLTNYRESNEIARKRISFEMAYNLVSHILETL